MEACEQVLEPAKPYAMFSAGVLFGAGWWVWGDAAALSVVAGLAFNPIWLIPGIIATLSILVMNCVPRSELSGSVYGDDATVCRLRLALFVSYVFSVAAIATAVGMLLRLKSQQAEDLWIGVAGIVQSCLVIAAGLVAWFFRESGDDSSYYMF